MAKDSYDSQISKAQKEISDLKLKIEEKDNENVKLVKNFEECQKNKKICEDDIGEMKLHCKELLELYVLFTHANKSYLFIFGNLKSFFI